MNTDQEKSEEGGKRIVVCCDGTSNEFGHNNSNVVKIYEMMQRHDPKKQLGYYDPGVGAASSYESLTRLGQKGKGVLGLAFGYGLTKNIQDAYKFLMAHYEPGDRVYLFGFSRGAYTARALAGMVHKCGLLHRDNANLISEATRIFRPFDNFDVAAHFKKTFSINMPIHFLGIWDTVTSVGRVREPTRLPYTASNPSVQIVRHAISIDEKRAFFRNNMWRGDKEWIDGKPTVQEVWFAGNHSDVGGGYRKNETQLSQIALEWLAAEAEEFGMQFHPDRSRNVLSDPAPNHLMQPSHDSFNHHSLGMGMKLLWRACEYYPKEVSYRRDDDKWDKSLTINHFKPRTISSDALFHESVRDRIRDVDDYRPVNLPKTFYSGASIQIPDSQIVSWKHLNGIHPPDVRMVFHVEAKAKSTKTFQVEKGKRYRFSASGEWYDASIRTDARGYATDSVKGYSNWILKQSERFRREREAQYFSLIGRVDDDPNTQFDLGKLIAENGEYEAVDTGTLTVFANDVPVMYWNNRGAISLEMFEA